MKTQLQHQMINLMKSKPSIKDDELAIQCGVTTAKITQERKSLGKSGNIPGEHGLTPGAEDFLTICNGNRPCEKRLAGEAAGHPSRPVNGGDLVVQAVCCGQNKDGVLSLMSKVVSLDPATSGRITPNGKILIVSPPNPQETVQDWEALNMLSNIREVDIAPEAHITPLELAKILPKKTQATRRFEEIATDLESRGLGVRTVDPIGRAGFTLNKKGFEVREKIREHRRLAPLRELEAKHVPQKIQCPVCKNFLAQTTMYFKPGGEITGQMLEVFGLAEGEGWTRTWSNQSTYEDIICPGCHSRLLDQNGTIPANRLAKI